VHPSLHAQIEQTEKWVHAQRMDTIGIRHVVFDSAQNGMWAGLRTRERG
jgi:hypothetical protein